MSRARTRGMRLLAVVAALILAIGVLQPRLALAAPLSISLNPASGQAGTTVVNVTGGGFGGSEVVNITFHNSTNFGVVGTTTSNGSGSIATQFVVPGGAAPGFYTVTATGATTGRVASAPFQVVTTAPTTSLSLAKSVSSPSSGLLTYQLTYTNTGAATATGVTIVDQLQGGQTLSPGSLSAGCTANSAGTIVTCVPNPTGTPGTVPPSPTAGYTGSFSFTTQINPGFTGTINNYATISANNAATQSSNTTSVSVGPGNPGPTSLQKAVEDNNRGFFATSVNANPGDVLTYDIAYINSSTTATSPSVTITDTLQPGQTYLGPPFSSSSCAPISANTISCPIGNVPPNTRVDVFISASVNSNVPGATITNQAQATSGGTTISSNTTTVVVGGSPPPCTTNCCFNGTTTGCCVSGFTTCCVNGTFTGCNFTGSFVLCGVVTAFTTSTITMNGVTLVFAPNPTMVGTITPGTNVCITFAFNSAGQITALAVSQNLATVAVVCGTFTVFNASGAMLVSGVPIVLAPTATFQGFLVPNAFFCFLVSPTGQAISILSGVPTSLQHAAAEGRTQAGVEKLL